MDRLVLVLRPIDLDRHVETCLAFKRDTHLCSFGSLDGFFDDDGRGEERFVERLRRKIVEEPQSCLHVWKAEQIVGQLHLGRFVDPSIGYINLLYVVPEWRGKGVAPRIEEYAAAYFRSRGFPAARLSVTAQNHRAIGFYLKQGWNDLGPRDDRPGTHSMEKVFG